MAKQTKRYSQSPYSGGSPSLFSDDELDMPVLADIDPEVLRRPPLVKFMSFGSGSSGNCSMLTDGSTGLLIDAGVDPAHVESGLRRYGYDMDHIRGILLTHDHSDHVRFVYKLVKNNRHIRVYCTPKAFNGIMRRHSISRRLKDYFQAIYKEFPFTIGKWTVTAFNVSHDGTDNAGYFLQNGPHTIAVATDLGAVTDRVEHYFAEATNVILEANYDARMLAVGPYPEFLKARIKTDTGHLDNAVTGAFIARLLKAHPDRLRRVFLCHLSHDNNTPATALATVEHALTTAEPSLNIIRDDNVPPEGPGRHLLLDTLPRFEASPLYTFRL